MAPSKWPPAFLDGLGVVDDVADVVERVEHAEDMHAVALGGLMKRLQISRE